MSIGLATVKKWLTDVRAEKTKRQSDGVSPADRQYNVYAAVAFAALMIGVGVPQWWRTTRVYRASLPYGDIGKFDYTTVILPVSVSLIAADDSIEAVMDEDKIEKKIENLVTKDFHRMKVSLKLTRRSSSDAENPILAKNFASFHELESALYEASISRRGKKIHTQDVKGDGIEIFVLNRPGELLRMHFGVGSRVFVVGDFVAELRNDLAEVLANVILHGYLRIDELLETVARHLKDDVKSISSRPKTNLSRGVLNPKMTLELHVVDPEPVRCAERFPVHRIVGDPTVKDFLSAFKGVTDVTLKSQMIYNVEFNQEPLEDGNNPPTYFLDPKSLQHLINPIETYLGTDVSAEPVYNMLLYVTPSASIPLAVPSPERFAKPVGHVALPGEASKRLPRIDTAPYNSFVVSGWGSVTVLNTNRTCVDGKELKVDAASIKAAKMALVANMRKFFGLQLPKDFSRTASAMLVDWEIQSLRYRALVEYIFSSISTLKSLTKLLGEITTIVINDEVAASIALAVSEIKSVLNATADGAGGHWRMHSMLTSATRAFEESEKAFFDPSLLALLYFPADQKYAIYVPLFLPIGVPVVGSVIFIYKHIKATMAKPKSE